MSDQEWHQYGSPSHGQPYQQPHYRPRYQSQYEPRYEPRPRMPEDLLKEIMFMTGRKSFQVVLKQNVNGRFLRITEASRGRFNSILLPAEGLKDMQKALDEIVSVNDKLPPPAPPASPDSARE
jgi:hypothetical protein